MNLDENPIQVSFKLSPFS